VSESQPPRRITRPPAPHAGETKARGLVGDWVDARQARRRYVFSLDDLAPLGLPASRLYKTLRRLEQRHRIAAVGKQRGLWVVVPAEYRDAGGPPVTWVLDDIMQALGQPYYVGLRSAAESYGATHHALQALQVIIPGRLRQFRLGRQLVRFVRKVDFEGTPTTDVTGPVTSLRYSTPEATALDMVRFATEAGGMHMVVVALQQLSGRCRVDGMRRAFAAADDTPNAQRLGYLWSLIGAPALARAAEEWLRDRPTRAIRLDRGDPERLPTPIADPRWKVRVGYPLDLTF